MKSTLEFDMNDPDEVSQHNLAVNAWKLVAVIQRYDNILRGWLKYDNPHKDKTADEALQEARDTLWNEVKDCDAGGLLE